MSNFIEENSELIMLRSMANVFMPEALDPVGKEDDDVDNDGDSDSSDAYLKKRRKAVGAAIAADRAKKKVKEQLEIELQEKVLYKSEKAVSSNEKQVEIVEKPVMNKIIVNPEMKESVADRIRRIYGDKYLSEDPIQDYRDRRRAAENKAGARGPELSHGGPSKGKPSPGSAATTAKPQPRSREFSHGSSSQPRSREFAREMAEGLKQARKNVGASTCWDGYTAKGTKKKNGREVPNCVKEWDEVESVDEGLSGERYKKALKKGKMYSRKVSEDPSKRAKRGGRGGESDFGAGDRGSGNKAARRAGTYQEEEFQIDEARRGPAAAGKEEKGKEVAKKRSLARTPFLADKFRKEHPGSRQEKKVKGEKETESEAQRRRTNRQVARVVKHGHTAKEKKESEARSKYDSARD